ncbi:hypothetical protein N7494_009979 [Penicillium frequentans]|uniref:Ankyrin repeat protein n=1 Tax=Penicillium frequentans TaxID=3151616 RepID=A0AAD6CQZ1_9EURO|nr:hypothetical protein N7494_009979 [Penicillium glabrum]
MSIIQFPTEILWIIASSLTGGEICAFAQVHRNIYPKLRLALIKHNVKHQNSSALHWAAKTNNRRFAKTLLSYRADINARVDGLSPLMTAAKYGSGRVINLLLQKKKLRVNMRNSQGESALWLSVATPATPSTQNRPAKLRRGPNRALACGLSRQQRLGVPATLKRRQPDAKDQFGISPWIQACISNRSQIVDLLLDHWKATSPEFVSPDRTLARREETVEARASIY